MCIIAVSKKGVRQPTLEQLHNMFVNNPDGAGYMYARDGVVNIHKGFMTWKDFERQIKKENFTKDDSVVYHFRISTQAGKRPEMTHPFPLTGHLPYCEMLDLSCKIGLAHNGIIRMTSFTKEVRYSDTAYFIAWYMKKLIRDREDITDACVTDMIEVLTNSKWAIMDGETGDVQTVGRFTDMKGLLFSNTTFLKTEPTVLLSGKAKEKSTGKYPVYTSYKDIDDPDSPWWDYPWIHTYGDNSTTSDYR